MEHELNPNDVTQRLERAVQLVSQAWFPVNGERLREIQTGLRSGIYQEKGDDLVTEIRKDFALFTYCLKEILLQAQMLEEELPHQVNPVELLIWAGVERLRPILLVSERQISRHILTQASVLQAGRFLEAMTSATTAELIAEHQGINPSLAYSAALIRQLGCMLIAWNYPDAYERAVQLTKRTQRFDVAVTQVLGFPPNLLGLGLARQWGLSDELCRIISHSTERLKRRRGRLTPKSEVDRVAFLCAVGEALARANDPEHYPTAAEDWVFASEEVQRELGPEGIAQISERLNTRYLIGLPLVGIGIDAESPLNLDPEHRAAAVTASEIERLNPNLVRCPPPIRAALEGLYRAILKQRDVRTNLQHFVRDVLTTSPWNGGCIYTLNSHGSQLIARTRFGKPAVAPPPSLDYLPYVVDADPINRALRAKQPIVDQQRLSDVEFVITLAGAIGSEEPLGVLYVEAPPESEERMASGGGDLLSLFQATTKALTDCLELSRMSS